MSRVLILSRDHVGSEMAGPGVRALRFAEKLASRHAVTLSLPAATDATPEGVEIVVADPFDQTQVGPLVETADVVVAQWLPVGLMRRLARSRTRAIYDLYDPWTIEELAGDARNDRRPPRPAAHRLARVVQSETLAAGDAFLCASERQRDFWLGWLAAQGRIEPGQYARDPSLRSLLDVVPFGIDTEPPRADAPVLRGVVDGIGADDSVILWGGGIWDWLDAETVIRAVAELAGRRSGIRLFFLGLSRPNPRAGLEAAGRRAVALAEELGIVNVHVFFNQGWVPHDRRGAYLLEADVGVVAHYDDIETRLAFRTRLLDYFWAGLPVVTTRGDVLSEEVERRGLGRIVAARDVAAWVEALDAVLDESDSARQRREAEMAELCETLAWPRVLEPLVRLIEDGPVRPAPRSTLDRAEHVLARLENAVEAHGPVGSASRLLRRAPGAANRFRIRRR